MAPLGEFCLCQGEIIYQFLAQTVWPKNSCVCLFLSSPQTASVPVISELTLADSCRALDHSLNEKKSLIRPKARRELLTSLEKQDTTSPETASVQEGHQEED